MNNKLISVIGFFSLFLLPLPSLAADKPVLIPFKKTNLIEVVGHSGSAATGNVAAGKFFGNDASANIVGTATFQSGKAATGDVTSSKTFSNYSSTGLTGDRDTTPKVAVSGQTIPYNNAPYGFTATHTDGVLQIGAAIPSVRFIDNNDGTVLDTMTGLTWLQRANCLGKLGWEAGLDQVNALKDGQCNLTDGSTAGDWRLPNILELQSILNYEYVNPMLSNSAGTAQHTNGDPFTGIDTTAYYTSTSSTIDTNTRYAVGLVSGLVTKEYNTSPFNIWAVK